MTAQAAGTQTVATPESVKVTESKKVEQKVGNLYLILEATAEDKTYRVAGNITARDNEHAIRRHSEQNGNKAGIYIALLASKWKPLVVTPQTVTTLKLEEAK